MTESLKNAPQSTFSNPTSSLDITLSGNYQSLHNQKRICKSPLIPLSYRPRRSRNHAPSPMRSVLQNLTLRSFHHVHQQALYVFQRPIIQVFLLLQRRIVRVVEMKKYPNAIRITLVIGSISKSSESTNLIFKYSLYHIFQNC